MKKAKITVCFETEIYLGEENENDDKMSMEIAINRKLSDANLPNMDIINIEITNTEPLDNEEKETFIDLDFCEDNPVFETFEFMREVLNYRESLEKKK